MTGGKQDWVRGNKSLNEGEELWMDGHDLLASQVSYQLCLKCIKMMMMMMMMIFCALYRLHRIINLNKNVSKNYVKFVYLMANVGDHVVM